MSPESPIVALARAMYHEQLNQLAGERPWDELAPFLGTRPRWMHKARVVIDMLAGAGYIITPDPDVLLQKGREAVRGGAVHD